MPPSGANLHALCNFFRMQGDYAVMTAAFLRLVIQGEIFTWGGTRLNGMIVSKKTWRSSESGKSAFSVGVFSLQGRFLLLFEFEARCKADCFRPLAPRVWMMLA